MRRDLLDRGLMDLIVVKMAAHKASADVQIYGCWALLELAAGTDGLYAVWPQFYFVLFLVI